MCKHITLIIVLISHDDVIRAYVQAHFARVRDVVRERAKRKPLRIEQPAKHRSGSIAYDVIISHQ